MIVVDTSSIVAIFRQEPDAARHAACIGDDDQPMISAASLVETSLVLRGLKRIAPDQAELWLDEFLSAAGLTIAPVTAEQTAIARQAAWRWRRAR